MFPRVIVRAVHIGQARYINFEHLGGISTQSFCPKHLLRMTKIEMMKCIVIKETDGISLTEVKSIVLNGL